MKKTLLCIAISIFGLMPIAIEADSLWDYAKPPFYGVSRRQIRVGDIITIYVSESTSAAQQASTSTEKGAAIEVGIEAGWEQISNLLGNETLTQERAYELAGSDEFEGTGKTSRRSQVKAVVASVVTEVLDNGNLYVEGVHQVKVNNEIETVRVAGLIRPQDISPKNSVFSYQIAKAEISVNGTGVVSAKQSPGIMTKLLNWMF